jgi:hypothetical protein
MRGDNPPRVDIQFRTGAGYIKYIVRVASGFVIWRPPGPRSQAAWKARFAFSVTQILFDGTFESTIVQAEAQSPSMTTVWPVSFN